MIDENKVYEFNIFNLSGQDARWEAVLEAFLASCTQPKNNDPSLATNLPLHRPDLHENARDSAPRPMRDTLNELFWKGKRFFRRGRYQQPGYQHQARADRWYPNHGKYGRPPSVNQHVIKVGQCLSQILGVDESLNDCQRGNFFYPAGGYREWHTNQFDIHGWRLYLVHTEPDNCAVFRYVDPHTRTVHSCSDYTGCMRMFKVRGGRNKLWHSIVSDGNRWSLGYVISDDTASKLVELFNPESLVVPVTDTPACPEHIDHI
jgi:hypothetical protein